MSSIKDMPDYLRAMYRNPENEVPIWKAAALVMDIPPEDFAPDDEATFGVVSVYYHPPGGVGSRAEQDLIQRQHASITKSLMNMVRNRGYEGEPNMFTEVLLWDVMFWCASHDGLHPEIWEGMDLLNPAGFPEKSPEQFEGLKVERIYPFLDKAHPHYSEELAAAIRAWLAFEHEDRSTAVKSAIEDWLKQNQDILGVSDKSALERIATVANWNKKGGTSKSGAKMQIQNIPSAEEVSERLGNTLRELTECMREQLQQGLEVEGHPELSYMPVKKIEQLLQQAVKNLMESLVENKTRSRPEVQERIAQLAEELKKARDVHRASKSDESDFSDVPF